MFVSKNLGEADPVADVDTSQMSTDVDKDDGESYVALDTLLASADNTMNVKKFVQFKFPNIKPYMKQFHLSLVNN